MKSFSKRSLALAFIGVCFMLSFTSCGNKRFDLEGRTYGVQCYWTDGPNDFSPKVTFNADGTILHRDDTTSSLTGSWSSSDQTATWTLDNPPKNTRFRGTFDKKQIQGNVEDDLGGKAIFQGGVE